jgi:methanogenic corrinoid protein MtbC1
MLSIGALSAATGIPAETIRTWERRYGFPVAQRKPSGHRLYPLDTVVRLRLIAEALARGYRAAEVVGASQGALEAMLATVSPGTGVRPAAPRPVKRQAAPATPGVASDLPRGYFDATMAFDTERLRELLQKDWARLGPMEFLSRRAAPFLVAIGEAWSKGTLDVRHEHFAAAVLGDFLREVRRPLEDRAEGPIIALATLSGELHGLGLEMCALVAVIAGWRPLVLGANTPVSQIVALAREAPVAAVGISCAPPAGRRGTAAALRLVRRHLPRHLPLLVGGGGAPRFEARTGIQVLHDLGSLERWLRDHSA